MATATAAPAFDTEGVDESGGDCAGGAGGVVGPLLWRWTYFVCSLAERDQNLKFEDWLEASFWRLLCTSLYEAFDVR